MFTGPGWTPAYIALGSNLHDPAAQVQAALAALAGLPTTQLVATSHFYVTRPFGPVAQDDFVNAVAGVLTQLSPRELLGGLQAIEQARGRLRAERWGPRIIDLDLLVHGQSQVDEPDLVVPHPGIAERGFVLRPLADVAPDLQIPGLGRVADLLRRLDPQDIRIWRAA